MSKNRILLDVQKAKFFKLLIDGVETLSVQSVSGLGFEFANSEHFSEGKIVNTASTKRATDVTFTKVVGLSGTASRSLYDWTELVENETPSSYKKDVVLQEFATVTGGLTRTWSLSGCYPLSNSIADYDQASEDNLIETFVLKVDDIELLA
jgi:phage tail-like protein